MSRASKEYGSFQNSNLEYSFIVIFEFRIYSNMGQRELQNKLFRSTIHPQLTEIWETEGERTETPHSHFTDDFTYMLHECFALLPCQQVLAWQNINFLGHNYMAGWIKRAVYCRKSVPSRLHFSQKQLPGLRHIMVPIVVASGFLINISAKYVWILTQYGSFESSRKSASEFVGLIFEF